MKKIILSLAVFSQIIFASNINQTTNQTTNNNSSIEKLVTNIKDETKVNWKSFKDLTKNFKNNSLSIQKPVLLFIATTTCNYCKKQYAIFNSDKNFVNYVNNNYYPVIVFQDQEKNLNPAYTTNITPTLMILNPMDLTQMTPDNTKGIHSSEEILYYLQQVKKGYLTYLKSNYLLKK